MNASKLLPCKLELTHSPFPRTRLSHTARAVRPAFEFARRGGLKVTVHCGEVSNDAEFLAVLSFRPERLGHAVILGKEVREALLSFKPQIPIEVCPTSNLLTLGLSGHGEHPTVRGWIEEG